MAKQVPERGKTLGAAARKSAAAEAETSSRNRLWRDLALIAIAPLLLYLLASLFTYSANDPGWSQTGSVVAPVHNMGGRVGAWIADVLLQLFGYVAFVLPVVLAAITWIALFGLNREDRGDNDLAPALRLVGIVGFLIAATGFLHLRLFTGDVGNAGGILGRLVGRSLTVGFGALGSNLFVLVLLLASITLATGLSWFAVMEKIGKWVLALGPLLNKKTEQAAEWQQTRALREERAGSAQGRCRSARQARAGEDRTASGASDREERARQARDPDPDVPGREWRRLGRAAAGAAG